MDVPDLGVGLFLALPLLGLDPQQQPSLWSLCHNRGAATRVGSNVSPDGAPMQELGGLGKFLQLFESRFLLYKIMITRMLPCSAWRGSVG